ncbi:HEAT repeat domain-containing protein [Actinoplanes sp. Pm04-4]|uniref:HEAT repeat domain-containing protein n=1 Tax=Paractinoplanes pyxinae TaxID=2997416 RepID=A0ABT4BGR4_9ACTN|nr:HEAT repeat domain-containing protein [Actinoplanes pyxinae]MCY1144750.1 HEAT repeat domain-containing protein [Actinoplanes pyxinae]
MTTVYVSATYEDLKECRDRVATAIRRLGMQDVAMESYVAESRRPLDRCLTDVRRCDVYVGIFAWRYGFVPPGHDRSITELEYEAAVEAGKPRLIFLLHEDSPWPRKYVDRDPDAIENLRRRLADELLCGMFTDPAHLAELATAALAGYAIDSGGLHLMISQEARRAYLDWLHLQLRNLDLDALTPPQHDQGMTRIQLASVFVEPSVRADPPPVELPREWSQPPDGAMADRSLPDDVDTETMAVLHDAYRAKPQQPVFDVLSDPRRRLVVLLGDPGAGKSTVARYVALQASEEHPDPRLAAIRDFLPIVVEVRMYAAMRAEGKCSTLLGYLSYRYRTGIFPLDPRTLRNHLDAGEPTAIIFDGLDEIFDGQRRQEVAEQVAAFAAQFPGTRVIVTSRILEYTSLAHGHVRRTLTNAGFEHFTLQDLGIDQITEFLTRWFVVVLQQNRADALQRSAGLVRDIVRSRPLRELAGNPMLLTILAIINRHQELPRNRRTLYQHAAGVLVEHWEVSRDLAAGGEAALSDAEDKHELLRRLAYEMQTGSTGLRGNYIARDDLIQVFVAYLAERYEHEPRLARRLAGQMIDQLRQRNFILSLYGSQMYGFVHRTFLEFFAAEAILDKFRHERAWTFDRIKETFAEHWPEASWREVLRLVAAVLSEADNGEVIELLALANPDWLVSEEAPLPWNLALGVQCLSQVRKMILVRVPAELLLRRLVLLMEQCAPLIEAAGEDPVAGFRLPRDTIDGAAALIEEEILPFAAVIGPAWPGRDLYLSWYSRRGRWIDNAVGGFAARLAGMLARPADQLPVLLGRVLETQGDVRIANAAVQGLTEAAERARARGTADDMGPTPLDELIKAARGDGRAVVRLAAVEALSRFLTAPDVRGVLESLARDDRSPQVRLAAVQRLGAEFGADERLVALLLVCARDARDIVRVAAVDLLAQLPDPGDDVEKALYDRCRRDDHAEVIIAAARPLLARSTRAGQVRNLLTDRSRQAPEAGVRAAAVRLLTREIDTGSQPELFLERARHDPSPVVIRAAVEALAPADASPILLDRLRTDPDEVVRSAIPEILTDVLLADDRLADELVRRVRDEPDATVRMALLAVLASARLLRNPQRRAEVLTIARDSSAAPAVRLAAVHAVTPGSPALEEADALAAITVTDDDTSVRLAAVAALPRWQLTGQVKSMLVTAVRRDPVAEVRLAGLERLLRDGPDPTLRALLQELTVRELDAVVFRTAAAAALAQTGDQDAGALLEKLERRSTDANPEVRSAVVRLLAEQSPAADHAYRVVRDRLRADHHPEVVAVAAEQAVRCFADRADLPGLLLSRLTGERTEIACAVARTLAHWCDEKDEVRRSLAEAATTGDIPLRCAALAAMGPTAGRDEVRTLLLTALRDEEPAVRSAAVRTLGRALGHDAEVRAVLIAALHQESAPEVRRVLEGTLIWTGLVDVEQFPDRFS